MTIDFLFLPEYTPGSILFKDNNIYDIWIMDYTDLYFENAYFLAKDFIEEELGTECWQGKG